MSGGSSPPDPYHQKDAPKKRFIPNEIPVVPKLANGRVFVIGGRLGKLIQQQKNKQKVYWYKCDGCQQPFPSRTRRYGKTTSCSLACKNKAQSKLLKGRKHKPESIGRMSRAQQKAWNNPEIAKRRRDAAKTRKKPKQFQRKKKPKKTYEYKCAHCGKQFKTERKRELENKYCSRKCVGQSQRKGRYVKCDNPNCSKEIWKKPAHLDQEKHYCSPECHHSDPYQHKRRADTSFGELNPNWEGGPGKSVGWETMAGRIRDRDNHECKACGKEHVEGYSFPVHHIKPEKDGGPDEEWNLVTLCPSCHYHADAQDGDLKIPKTPDGVPIRNEDELKKRWEEFLNDKEKDNL